MRKGLSRRWIDVLKKRQIQVAAVRDKLREDVEEIEGLKESCERAYDDIQHAIDALSELA